MFIIWSTGITLTEPKVEEKNYKVPYNSMENIVSTQLSFILSAEWNIFFWLVLPFGTKTLQETETEY